jgi:hypothetical protein
MLLQIVLGGYEVAYMRRYNTRILLLEHELGETIFPNEATLHN